MNITIIGTGYVGLATGVCLAEKGHNIICCDIDEDKINLLKQGKSPIFEPGLEKLLQANQSRLSFTTNIEKAIQKAEIIVGAVGTPMDDNGTCDLSQIQKMTKDLGMHLRRPATIIIKSTVPPGTTKTIKQELEDENHDVQIVFNPEFLKQGSAINDTQHPDRIILGVDNDEIKPMLEDLFKPFGAPIMFTDIPTAELIKYAANAFLSTKISFINEIAELSRLEGANIKDIAKGIGLDPRIGPDFLQAGIGYGGNCLKKDINALMQIARKHNYVMKILREVEQVNEDQKLILYEKLLQKIPNLHDKTIAVWGLTFKPNTDDFSDAPSISIIQNLQKAGAKIHVYDPIAAQKFAKTHKNLDIQIHETPLDAAKNADAVMLLTQWDQFHNIDFQELAKTMRGNLVLDGRNIYDPSVVRSAGLEYIGIGIK